MTGERKRECSGEQSIIRRLIDAAPWKQTSSTSSRIPSKTSRPARRSCGGIFDYDAKKSRLVEVSRALEDPGVWNDAKRAQDLGKERRQLMG